MKGRDIQKYGQHILVSPRVIEEIVDTAQVLKAENLVEIGPGQVLSGLIKKINPEIKTFNISCVEHINSISQELQAVL